MSLYGAQGYTAEPAFAVGDLVVTRFHSRPGTLVREVRWNIGGTFRYESGDGFCCSSGFGDGAYNCDVVIDGDGLKKATVMFITDDDDEE